MKLGYEVWTVGDRTSINKPSLVFTLGTVQPQRRRAPVAAALMSWTEIGEAIAAGLDVNQMLKQKEGERNATQPQF